MTFFHTKTFCGGSWFVDHLLQILKIQNNSKQNKNKKRDKYNEPEKKENMFVAVRLKKSFNFSERILNANIRTGTTSTSERKRNVKIKSAGKSCPSLTLSL